MSVFANRSSEVCHRVAGPGGPASRDNWGRRSSLVHADAPAGMLEIQPDTFSFSKNARVLRPVCSTSSS